MKLKAHTIEEMKRADRDFWNHHHLLAGPHLGGLAFRYRKINQHLVYRVALSRDEGGRWMSLITLSSRHPHNRPVLLRGAESREAAESEAGMRISTLEDERKERTRNQKRTVSVGIFESLPSTPPPECSDCGALMGTFTKYANAPSGRWECDCRESNRGMILGPVIGLALLFAIAQVCSGG